MIETITNIDLSILQYVQEHIRNDFMTPIWKFITHLGDGGWLWITLGVVLLFFKKTRLIGFSVLVSLLINAIFTNITLKDLIGRPRPYTVSNAIVPIIKLPSELSFPSGHTSSSFAAALVLLKLTPKKYGIPAVVLAALISLSRIYVGVHYPTDILGGIVVGIISSIWGCYLVKCIYIRIKERKVL